MWTMVSVIGAVITVVAAILLAYNLGKDDDSSTPASAPVAASASECVNGYPLDYDPNATGNVVEKKANSNYAVENPDDILANAKKNPKVLAGYGTLFLPAVFPDSTKWQSLVNQSGKCLSADGVKAYVQLEAYVRQSDWHVGQAAPDMVNTGMGAPGIVSNAAPGITGDLKAVIFVTPDGRKVVILERCGNPAEYKPSYPPVSPPPPTETPSCEQTGTCAPPPCTVNCTPPPCTVNCGPPPCMENCGPPPCPPNQNGVCVQPKDPAVDPYPQGNAPQGGGPNDQPGPGDYRPPESMPQPPSTPRVNPPPPVVTGPSAPTHVTAPVTAPPPEPGVNGTGNGAGSATVTHPDGSTATVNTGTVAPPK